MLNRLLTRFDVLLTLLVSALMLQGCFVNRLMTVREQMCEFETHFRVSLEPAIEVEFLSPVLLEQDIAGLLDIMPSAVTVDGDVHTNRFVFEKLEESSGGQKLPTGNEFVIEFDYWQSGDQSLLSAVRTSDIPEGLRRGKPVTQTDLLEMALEACNTSITALSLRPEMPIDPSMLEDLPTRAELLAALGPPTTVIHQDNALVYEYRLQGSDDPAHVARFKALYDPAGIQPLLVESSFGDYLSRTDLVAGVSTLDF